ncbi:hypothetical protein M3B46_08340 [Sphingobacterium daejeonense]|uniref:hypothetical protein n=1 Tax=Sphingobacterium daejeonense TaxID=371142 RepID=UPI0021A43864|nr:hypothetical protein [Sphingobacterium daejeonense]MCT1530999.1 hypothetical protein [Sphingobacterium daejeonense]
MIKYIISLFLLLYLTSTTLAQENSKTTILEVASSHQDSIFDRTLSHLILSDFFVVSADKESGFIQCKLVIEDKRWLRLKKGDIIHYNLLFSNESTKDTKIFIQTNLTTKSIQGTYDNSSYFNNDLGLTPEPKYINPLVDQLKIWLDGN